MKYFVPGSESREVVELVLSLVRVENEGQELALYAYLCDGAKPTVAAALYDCTLSNFNRTLARVSEVFETFEKLFEIKYRPPQKSKGPRVVDTRSAGIHPPSIS